MDYSLIDGQNKMTSDDYLKYADKNGTLKSSMKYRMPPPTVELIIPIAQAILMLVGGWLISEYQPTYASAHRLPHQIFTKYFMSTKEYGFTKKAKHIRTKKLFARKCERKPIQRNIVEKCIAEGKYTDNTEACEMVRKIMTDENNDNTVLLTHHLHKTYKRPKSQ